MFLYRVIVLAFALLLIVASWLGAFSSALGDVFTWLQGLLSPLEDLVTGNKIPIGKWLNGLVDLIKVFAVQLLRLISIVVKTMIDGTTDALTNIPSPLMIVLLVALTYALRRSWQLALFVGLAFLMILNLGYWEDTIRTLSLILFSTLTCMVVGLPLGIMSAHRPWLYYAMRPVLDLMQTLPTFVYLIPTLVFFGLGVVPGLLSTAVFALPAPIRMTHLGITSVPRPLLEAGEAFGATRRQLLWKVELPSAMPMILAGLTQCIMLCLSMVVIAALVGAGGLGVPVLRALNTVNVAQGFEAGLCIVLLAIVLDRVCRPAEKGASR